MRNGPCPPRNIIFIGLPFDLNDPTCRHKMIRTACASLQEDDPGHEQKAYEDEAKRWVDWRLSQVPIAISSPAPPPKNFYGLGVRLTQAQLTGIDRAGAMYVAMGSIPPPRGFPPDAKERYTLYPNVRWWKLAASVAVIAAGLAGLASLYWTAR